MSSRSAFASTASALLPLDTACRSANASAAATLMESGRHQPATIEPLLSFCMAIKDMDIPLPHWITSCNQPFMQRSSRSCARHHLPRTSRMLSGHGSSICLPVKYLPHLRMDTYQGLPLSPQKCPSPGGMAQRRTQVVMLHRGMRSPPLVDTQSLPSNPGNTNLPSCMPSTNAKRSRTLVSVQTSTPC